MATNQNRPILNGNGGGGGIGLTSSGVGVVPPLIGVNTPTQQFDITPIANLRPQDKFQGNLVGDIREAYQTYLSGTPVGRGGQYAVDAARKYGTTITEAARGYLERVGLPILAAIVPGGGNGNTTNTAVEQLQKQLDEIQKNLVNNSFRILSDQLSTLFGAPVNNPPLQSQATGYTPVTTSSPIGGASSSMGLYIILGVVGVIAYFVYKRFAG